MRKVNIGTNNYTEVYTTDEQAFNGVNGCHNEDLIAIVLDRLYSLNQGDFKCRENSIAITKLEEAMMQLNKRTLDRRSRGVEDTSQK